MSVLNEVGLYYETNFFSLITILKIAKLPPKIKGKRRNVRRRGDWFGVVVSWAALMTIGECQSQALDQHSSGDESPETHTPYTTRDYH